MLPDSDSRPRQLVGGEERHVPDLGPVDRLKRVGGGDADAVSEGTVPRLTVVLRKAYGGVLRVQARVRA